MGIADSCLILTNEQQMCINIISCLILLKIMKLKARRKLFLSYNQLTELFAYIFGKTVEGGIIPGQIVFSTMTYHFYFKNSKPVYETEYMQSLRQFAVQEVFPTYVLKVMLCLSVYLPMLFLGRLGPLSS